MYFHSSTKRNRGVILTPEGWHKLQAADVFYSELGERYSLEKLGEYASLDRRTVSKILGRKQGVDRRTLQLFFQAFDLELAETDYEIGDRRGNINHTAYDNNDDQKSLELPEGEIDYYPDGPVPSQSRFYIERPPIEELAKAEVNKPGSLVRIKAPRQMGKSSLLLKIMEVASRQNYRVVHLDFQQADESIFANSDRFLRWFCNYVALHLGLKPQLNHWWDEEIGSKICSTHYFQECILEQIETPLLLSLNEVNIIFEHPTISKDFLPLLRFWHEQAKQDDLFQKLRLVIVHSTEVYVPLNIHQSPFNVGLTLELPQFNREQILELARRYNLGCMDKTKVERLMAMVGGHPYLVRLALYHLSYRGITLEQLLAQAPTQKGIYHHHLQSQLSILRQKPKLLAAFQQIVKADEGIAIDPLLAYQLDSLGLVKFKGNEVRSSCQLYSLYFNSLKVKVSEKSFRE